MENMMDVVCISERETKEGQIIVGDFYYIDRRTIWLDRDGDAYGAVYDDRGDNIGNIKLSHFCSLK